MESVIKIVAARKRGGEAKGTVHVGKTPEGKVVAAVKQWAKFKPDVYLVRVLAAGSAGTPDFVLCIRGKFVAVECKAKGGSPRRLQVFHLNCIREAGGHAEVVSSPEEVEAFLESIYAS